MQNLIEEYRVLKDVCDVIIEEVIPDLPKLDEFDFPIAYRARAEWISVDIPLSIEAYRRFRVALGSDWELDDDDTSNGLDQAIRSDIKFGLRLMGKGYWIHFKHRRTGVILDVTRSVNVYEMECE